MLTKLCLSVGVVWQEVIYPACHYTLFVSQEGKQRATSARQLVFQLNGRFISQQVDAAHTHMTLYFHMLLSCFQVVDHYENPRNVGSLDKNDQNVGTGLVGAPACGDVMKLQVRPMSCYAMS